MNLVWMWTDLLELLYYSLPCSTEPVTWIVDLRCEEIDSFAVMV